MPSSSSNNDDDDDDDDDDDYPNLNHIISSIGMHIFTYLPLGSILNGNASPLLVNTIFHDAIYQSLGQTSNLSLSQCAHLRKINDDALINLITNIVEVSEAYHPGYTRQVQRRRRYDCSNTSNNGVCPCPIKVTHLDVSRCRMLKGEGIHYCLKHMPGVERVICSATLKFDATNHFATCGDLHTSKLEYLDVSGCVRLDNIGIKRLVTTVQGKHIRHLDFSGCSNLIDDSVAGTVAFCQGLECLNVAGAVDLTAFGVGLIAYVCRSTLRCLSLRECKSVNLPKLLMSASDELIDLAGSEDDHRALPPNFKGDTNDRSLYIAALCSVLVQMMRVHDNVGEILHMSQRYMASFKKLDDKWSTIWGLNVLERRNKDDRLFGNLEVLDIGHVGNSNIRLEGCIATIAWLNGGKLKQVDLEGLENVSHFDVSVLGSTSRNNFKRLNASSITDLPSEHSSCFFFHAMKNISELDLSGCKHWQGNSKGVALVFLTNLRSLKLDNTDIKEAVLVTVLTKCKKLLNLSVSGCRDLTSSKICAAKLVNRDLRLLELDCRYINLDASLWKIQKVYPSLLRLNARCTEKGRRMLKAHQTSYSWRVGARESRNKSCKSKKRKRGNNNSASSSNDESKEVVSFSSNRCSILSTGVSYSKSCEQEMFGCKTCGIGFGNFVCLACSKKCHEGHEVFAWGMGWDAVIVVFFPIVNALNLTKSHGEE
eukprot:CAMPEP_0201662338 /NCGR_PEP_ID=MMETSP0494-20130426/4446_1 /ASSEMBLY_ACC=CAM_ASM_000839 /TAXON_ID=420259 /ORGANISM="Thalassiosira gravida, Strain GMp14c1" /LENGTH=708 /DNA_ID=CAMNT_0048140671 /DNA_START=62 /DNA_END=2189 /DNA_ORIENTATION=+